MQPDLTQNFINPKRGATRNDVIEGFIKETIYNSAYKTYFQQLKNNRK